MSISCYKDYTLVIGNAAPSEYWKFDEAATPWLGSIHGATTQISNIVVPFPSASGAGLIAGGLRPGIAGTGTSVNEYVALAYTANNGWSVNVWYNFGINVGMGVGDTFFFQHDINWSSGTGASGLPPMIRLNGSLNHPSLGVYNLTAPFTYYDRLNNSVVTVNLSPTFSAPTGWVMVTFTFNQNTKDLKWYVNSILSSTTNVTNAPVATTNFRSYLSFTKTLDWAGVDEMGVWMDHVLGQSEITTLYNGGAGARPTGV